MTEPCRHPYSKCAKRNMSVPVGCRLKGNCRTLVDPPYSNSGRKRAVKA